MFLQPPPVLTSFKHRPLRDLNFTAPLSLSVDGKFGGKNKDGSWNGMVGMLTRNETGKESLSGHLSSFLKL